MNRRQLISRFRNWNERLTVRWARDWFHWPESVLNGAYKASPYAWMWMLVPIAGIAGFYGVGWEWSINERWRNLREMEAATKQS